MQILIYIARHRFVFSSVALGKGLRTTLQRKLIPQTEINLNNHWITILFLFIVKQCSPTLTFYNSQACIITSTIRQSSPFVGQSAAREAENSKNSSKRVSSSEGQTPRGRSTCTWSQRMAVHSGHAAITEASHNQHTSDSDRYTLSNMHGLRPYTERIDLRFDA